jgi:MFS family permease
MVGRDDRRRPRGDEGATSTSGWEATKPLNASDRVEDAHVEDALDAPLRRGVELARLALVASLGGFARGYDAVVAATAVTQARDELVAGRWLEYAAPAVAASGALAGAAFGGVASDAFGRKRVAYACDALFVAGSCLALAAPDALTLALSRLVTGLASGASAANAPAFLMELAPKRIRGAFVAADAFAAAAGALAGRILAPRDTDTLGGLWRVSLGATAIVPAVQAVCMFWVPESPAWLANKSVARKKKRQRRAGFEPRRRYGGGYGGDGERLFSATPGVKDEDDSDTSFDDEDDDDSVSLDDAAGGSGASSLEKAGLSRLRRKQKTGVGKNKSAKRGWFSFARLIRSLRRVSTREDLRPRLRLAVALQAAQQLVGAQALAYYGSRVAQAAGVAGMENAAHIAVAVATLCVLGCLAGAAAAETLGRRPAFLGSALACAAALGVLAAVFYDLERGTSAPVSEVPSGACAAAASCRECLFLACGFCAAGGADAATAPGRCLAVAADGLPANSLEAILAEERRRDRKRLANEAPPWSDAFIHHHETRSPPPPPPPPQPEADGSRVASTSDASGGLPSGFSAVARPPASPPPPIPPAPAPPRAKHRAHQNIVACDGNWQNESCPSRFKLGALVAYAAFFFSYHFGVAIVPWIISAEMFPVDVRGAAIGVAAFVHFLANALLAVLYPVMFEAMGAAVTFSVLFVCAKAAFGLAAFSTPETRDSSVSEIAVKVRHADPRRFFSFRDSRAAGEGARGSAAASASARGGFDRLATETYA